MKNDSISAPSSRPQRSGLWIIALLCVIAGVILVATVFMTGIGIGLIILGLLLGIMGWILQRKKSAEALPRRHETRPPRIVP